MGTLSEQVGQNQMMARGVYNSYQYARGYNINKQSPKQMINTILDRLLGDAGPLKRGQSFPSRVLGLKKAVLHLALSLMFSESAASTDQHFHQPDSLSTLNVQSVQSVNYLTRQERRLSEPQVSCYGTGKVFGQQQAIVTSDLPFILANESWDAPAVLAEVRFATSDSPHFALQVVYQMGDTKLKEGPVHGSKMTKEFQILSFHPDDPVQIDEVQIGSSHRGLSQSADSKSNSESGNTKLTDVETPEQNKLINKQEAKRVSFISLMTASEGTQHRQRPPNSATSFTPLKQSKGLIELTEEETTAFIKQGNKKRDSKTSEKDREFITGFTFVDHSAGESPRKHQSAFTESQCFAETAPRLVGFITSSATENSDEISSIQFIYHGSDQQQCSCLSDVIEHEKHLSDSLLQGYHGKQQEQFKTTLPEEQLEKSAKSSQTEVRPQFEDTVEEAAEGIVIDSSTTDYRHKSEQSLLRRLFQLFKKKTTFVALITTAPIMLVLCASFTFCAYKKRKAAKEHLANQQRASDTQRSSVDQAEQADLEIQHRPQIHIPANIIANDYPLSPTGVERVDDPPAPSSGATSANVSHSPQCPSLQARFPIQLGSSQTKIRIHVLNPDEIAERQPEAIEEKSPKRISVKVIKDDENKSSELTDEGSTLDQQQSIIRAQESQSSLQTVTDKRAEGSD